MNFLYKYETLKTVRITDPKLGLLYYGLLVCVVLYSFFTIIVSKGYFEYEPHIIGAISMHIHKGDSENKGIDTTLLNYCMINETDSIERKKMFNFR